MNTEKGCPTFEETEGRAFWAYTKTCRRHCGLKAMLDEGWHLVTYEGDLLRLVNDKGYIKNSSVEFYELCDGPICNPLYISARAGSRLVKCSVQP